MSLSQIIEDTDLESFIKEIKYHELKDITLIEEAYKFSMFKHKDQKRKSGDPYFIHCKETARILASWRMDAGTISAGLLHDVLEDTPTTFAELAEEFGTEIAQIVEGVTKINKIEFRGIEKQAENLRKMILAITKDIRVVLIKLADRLHNMRTLEFLSKESQLRIAQETLEIYAQLAHRLGMEKVSAELKDFALKYLDEEIYDDIAQRVEKELKKRGNLIEEFNRDIKNVLLQSEIQSEVEGRQKDIYSIYQKMKTKELPFEDVYDLFAFRVLVNSINDCYVSLGAIHSKWKPVPGRIKDYIAMPKTNDYQSLHTTIIGPGGKPVEIQIRTFEMHKVAEYGIAAHWKYKEGKITSTDDKRFTWLRQIVEDLQELRNPRHFMESVKVELFPEEVYVFTPKGEVKVLPQGATPIDFAYSIHTEIGQQCVGAKVNGLTVPFKYELKSGDVIEVFTRSGAHPSKDWLKYAKSSKARSKIRHWIRQQEREGSIKMGEEMLVNEIQARKLNLSIKTLLKSEELLNIAEQLNFTSIEDLLAHIGYGRESAQHVINLLAPETEEKEVKKPEEHQKMTVPSSGVKVGGVGHPFIRFAKCCNPIPGDEIVGFITRGRGVTVHIANCREISGETERIIDVDWNIQGEALYPVEISIESDDKKGMLADLAATIAKEGVNIESGIISTRNDMAATSFIIQVTGVEHLRKVMNSLRHIKGIKNVERRI